MLKTNRKFLLTICFISAFSVLLITCDNTLSPIDENKGVFSVYGYLDVEEEINYIRVKDLNTPLDADTTGSIDAEVMLEDLDTGTLDTLQDTVVEFDGVNTHNYYSAMDILYENKYRLTIERSDGEKVTVTATSPKRTNVEVSPTEENCITPFDIHLDAVDDPGDLNLWVGFHFNNRTFWALITSPDPIPPDEAPEQGITFRITPKIVLNEIFQPQAGGEDVWCHELDDDQLIVRFTHFGPDFAEDNSTSTLENPLQTTRFGALYSDMHSFRIDTTEI